jgi:hypothetical protein
VAIVAPAPRIGKFAGPAMPARAVRKPPKARKAAKQKPIIQPLAPGLINR